jgi:hypothetical protein
MSGQAGQVGQVGQVGQAGRRLPDADQADQRCRDPSRTSVERFVRCIVDVTKAPGDVKAIADFGE